MQANMLVTPTLVMMMVTIRELWLTWGGHLMEVALNMRRKHGLGREMGVPVAVLDGIPERKGRWGRWGVSCYLFSNVFISPDADRMSRKRDMRICPRQSDARENFAPLFIVRHAVRGLSNVDIN